MGKKKKLNKRVRKEANAIIKRLGVNAAEAETIRGRIASAISGGYDYADTLHNIYLDFGYPETLSFSNFWNMYRRFGIASNTVDLPIDTGWMTFPEVESSNEFVREIDDLDNRLSFWKRIRALDNRQRVGRYAGMFMRVRDNKNPSEEIEGQLAGSGGLMQMIPLYEGQLKVLETDSDPRSEAYGQPIMYQFSGNDYGNRSDSDTFNIHPSRLIIAAEGADNGSVYGVSALESPYNSLMDLRKIIGAGGEGFYKNASQTVLFKLADGATAAANKELLDGFNDSYDEFSRNRMRRGLWTPGLDPKTLEASLANPKEFFMNALYDVSAASKIPATILIGQQTGRLASSEDSRHFLSMVNSRRQNYMTGLIDDVISWCVNYGILPSADYELVWDDLLALSDTDKLDNADKMADINSKQFQSGGGTTFEGVEIREAAGYLEELDQDESGEDGDEDED